MSCDLLDTEIPGNHYRGDARDILNDGWDLMIAHPPCTYLCSSGMHWTTRGLRDPNLTEDALGFVKALLNAPIPSIGLENPIGCISTRIRKPDQIIQPWMFGEDASKATCFWLKGLLPLRHTIIIPPNGWENIKFAGDCPDCEEPWCEEHQKHYWECDCYGPTQDGIEYVSIKNYLFGRLEGNKGKAIWANQTPSGQNSLPPSKNRASERSITYQGIAKAMAEQWS